VKDALERRLHELVCAGQLDLKTAQSEIASNWIEAYNKEIRSHEPSRSNSPRDKDCTGNYDQRRLGKHALRQRLDARFTILR
jgi:hypothetical protein